MYTPKVIITQNCSSDWGSYYTVSILEEGALEWQEIDIGKIALQIEVDECLEEWVYYDETCTVLNYHILSFIVSKLKELNS